MNVVIWTSLFRDPNLTAFPVSALPFPESKTEENETRSRSNHIIKINDAESWQTAVINFMHCFPENWVRKIFYLAICTIIFSTILAFSGFAAARLLSRAIALWSSTWNPKIKIKIQDLTHFTFQMKWSYSSIARMLALLPTSTGGGSPLWRLLEKQTEDVFNPYNFKHAVLISHQNEAANCGGIVFPSNGLRTTDTLCDLLYWFQKKKKKNTTPSRHRMQSRQIWYQRNCNPEVSVIRTKISFCWWNENK